MLTQPRGFLLVQQHLAGLDDIKVGKIKQPRIHDFHRVRCFTVGSDGRQTLHSPDELAVRGGIIRAPAAAEAALPPLQIVAFESSQERITRREWSAWFRNAYARIYMTRVVVLRVVIEGLMQGPGNQKHQHSEEH